MNTLCLYCHQKIYPCKIGPIDDQYYKCEKCDVFFLLHGTELSLVVFSRNFQETNHIFYLSLKRNESEIIRQPLSNESPVYHNYMQNRLTDIKFNLLLPVTPDNVMCFIEQKLKLYILFS
jgi:hypothetical protein